MPLAKLSTTATPRKNDNSSLVPLSGRSRRLVAALAACCTMVLIIYTTDEVLCFGLELFGMDRRRQQRQQRETNIEDFKAQYGVSPVVYAQIWEDLQTTTLQLPQVNGAPPQSARINTEMLKGNVNLETFLRSLHFMKCYPTEKQRKGPSGHCETTVRKWCWYFLERIQALKAVKVSRPTDAHARLTNRPTPLSHACSCLLQIVWPNDNEWNCLLCYLSGWRALLLPRGEASDPCQESETVQLQVQRAGTCLRACAPSLGATGWFG